MVHGANFDVGAQVFVGGAAQPTNFYRVLYTCINAGTCTQQASTLGWERFVGSDGAIIGMRTFGASAPLKDVQKKFGFTPDAIVEACRRQLELHGRVRG